MAAPRRAFSYLPHKILTYIWYGSYPWLRRDGLKVHIRIEKGIRTIVRRSNKDLRGHFVWLQTCGYIKNFWLGCDEITLELIPPKWNTEDVGSSALPKEERSVK